MNTQREEVEGIEDNVIEREENENDIELAENSNTADLALSVETSRSPSSPTPAQTTTDSDDNNDNNSIVQELDQDEEAERENASSAFHIADALSPTDRTTAFTLLQQRLVLRNRWRICVVFHCFLLIQFWTQLFSNHGDFGFLLLTLVGLSYTSHWIREIRDQVENVEEELRRLILAGGGSAPMTLWPAAPGPRQGVTSEQQEKWKCITYEAVAGEQDENNQDSTPTATCCSICLGDYEQGEKLTQLPCQHVYHPDCIASWTVEHTKCPLCNYDLAAEGEDNEIV